MGQEDQPFLLGPANKQRGPLDIQTAEP